MISRGVALWRVSLGERGDWIRDPVDLLRATLLIGAFAMSVTGDYAAATRMVLTFVAVVIARGLAPPTAIDYAFTLGMLLQGWGNALGLFEAWPWYNKIVHFVLPFGGSAVLYVLLARLGVVCDLHHGCNERQSLGIVLVTLAVGFTAGGFYEVWEWFIHHNLEASVYITYDDTITDMVDNALGSLVGGLVLGAGARSGWRPTPPAPFEERRP